MKNVYLISFSPGGTTKKSIQNIADGMDNINITEIDMMRPENRKKKYVFGSDDLVIVGMPTATKLFGLPKEILAALSGKNTPFVGVVTCGNGYYGKGLIVLKTELEKNGFKMVAAGGFVGQYSFDKSVAAGRPDDKDRKDQMTFGQSIFDKVFIKNDRSFDEKLSIDWPNEGAFSTVKCALISAAPIIGAGLPKSWNTFEVSDKCVKCKKCVHHCPVEAISMVDDQLQFNMDKCIGCQGCVNVCPVEAIKQVNPTLNKMTENVKQHRHDRKPLDFFI